MKNDLYITLCMSFLILFFLISESYLYVLNTRLQKQVESLATKIDVELEETENKCQRMTDTCIDILANRRWE